MVNSKHCLLIEKIYPGPFYFLLFIITFYIFMEKEVVVVVEKPGAESDLVRMSSCWIRFCPGWAGEENSQSPPPHHQKACHHSPVINELRFY